MERQIVLKNDIKEALLDGVGEEGTIMMPTQSWKNLVQLFLINWTLCAEYFYESATQKT